MTAPDGGCMVAVTARGPRGRQVRHRCRGKIVGQVIYEIGDAQDTQWVCLKHQHGDPARVMAADRVRFQAL